MANGTSQNDTPVKPEVALASTDLRYGPWRVLIADDHQFHRNMATRVLQKHGCYCVAACDGRAAIAAWEKEPFDAVMLDVQMPELDGYHAAMEIRRLEKPLNRHQLLIAQTAYCTSIDRDRCVASGMDGYLSKPWRFEDLAELMAAWYSGTARKGELLEVGPKLFPTNTVARHEVRQSPTTPGGHDFGPSLARLGNDQSILIEQLHLFRVSSVSLMNDLAAAVIQHEWLKISKIAHRLKGLLVTFDEAGAIQTAEQLEEIPKTFNVVDAAALFARLRQQIDQFQREVDRYLRTINQG